MAGSPKDVKKTNAARRLDELDISYEIIHFEAVESDLSAERAADDVGMPREVVYKTLVLRGDRTGILEACIPAGFELDLKQLALLSGNKNVAMVRVKELTALTGYVRGGCSPIGGRKRYPVYVFDEMMSHERIAINAGSRGVVFLMSPRDLIEVTGAVAGKIARAAV
ncbi:MAG: aminoacyl-tRNA deacylase [Synergistaceae bacterium]|jgi:Cys-tRNA(Pro)/Cys-tRNA(Cys) deacylase|nr:aminoacyl-tRNA deacylase [Synergistaceae bacterium]